MTDDIEIGPDRASWEEAREIVRSLAAHGIANATTPIDPVAHVDLESITFRLAGNAELTASTVWILSRWFAQLFDIAAIVIASEPSDAIAIGNVIKDDDSRRAATRQAFEDISEMLAKGNF